MSVNMMGRMRPTNLQDELIIYGTDSMGGGQADADADAEYSHNSWVHLFIRGGASVRSSQSIDATVAPWLPRPYQLSQRPLNMDKLGRRIDRRNLLDQYDNWKLMSLLYIGF